MADQKEPKKETVRITLPPRPAGQPAAPVARGRDTVRINMPARPPAAGMPPRPPAPGGPVARPPTAQTPLPPAPPRPVTPPPVFRSGTTPTTTAAALPARPSALTSAAAPPGPSAGPRKETARITVLPDPPAKQASAVQMKKTQPLVTMPEPIAQPAPITVAPAISVETVIDSIPMSLCWGLLAASAITLIIQIWNYFA
jgi:hypothetical protein